MNGGGGQQHRCLHWEGRSATSAPEATLAFGAPQKSEKSAAAAAFRRRPADNRRARAKPVVGRQRAAMRRADSRRWRAAEVVNPAGRRARAIRAHLVPQPSYSARGSNAACCPGAPAIRCGATLTRRAASGLQLCRAVSIPVRGQPQRRAAADRGQHQVRVTGGGFVRCPRFQCLFVPLNGSMP